jgi:hypothetical protein
LIAKRVLVIDKIEINKVEEIIQLVVAPKDYRKIIKKYKAKPPIDNNALELKKSSNREA